MSRFIALRCSALFFVLLAGSHNAATQAVEARQSPLKIITLSTPLIAKPLFERGHPPVENLYLAYAALGYQLKVVFRPSLRSLALANTGEVDGEVARSRAIEAQYSNLLRVDIPFTQIEPVIYSRASTSASSWRRHKINTLAVGRGSILLKNAIPPELRSAELRLVNSTIQSMQMLNAGRVEAILLSRLEFEAFSLRQPKLTEQLIKLQPELPPITLYTYLHKRHSELLPKLAEQLRKQYPLK